MHSVTITIKAGDFTVYLNMQAHVISHDTTNHFIRFERNGIYEILDYANAEVTVRPW